MTILDESYCLRGMSEGEVVKRQQLGRVKTPNLLIRHDGCHLWLLCHGLESVF
jgi:hypothetical protein